MHRISHCYPKPNHFSILCHTFLTLLPDNIVPLSRVPESFYLFLSPFILHQLLRLLTTSLVFYFACLLRRLRTDPAILPLCLVAYMHAYTVVSALSGHLGIALVSPSLYLGNGCLSLAFINSILKSLSLPDFHYLPAEL